VVRRLFVELVAVASRKGERLFWRMGWVGGCGNGRFVGTLLALFSFEFESQRSNRAWNGRKLIGMGGNDSVLRQVILLGCI
jgi:hypothetical protein